MSIAPKSMTREGSGIVYRQTSVPGWATDNKLKKPCQRQVVTYRSRSRQRRRAQTTVYVSLYTWIPTKLYKSAQHRMTTYGAHARTSVTFTSDSYGAELSSASTTRDLARLMPTVRAALQTDETWHNGKTKIIIIHGKLLPVVSLYTSYHDKRHIANIRTPLVELKQIPTKPCKSAQHRMTTYGAHTRRSLTLTSDSCGAHSRAPPHEVGASDAHRGRLPSDGRNMAQWRNENHHYTR